MRCRTLAGELRRRGADVLLLCRELPGNLIRVLRDDGLAVVQLPPVADYLSQANRSGYAAWLGVSQEMDAAQTRAALKSFSADWLVVDHYGLDREWEALLHSQAGAILALDDLARAHVCDVLLDQNWFGAQTGQRYAGRVSDRCRQLLGPRYALLHPAYAKVRNGLPVREGRLRRILVFFGGVDSRHLTVQALEALSAPSLRDLDVDVVIGSANSQAQTIERLVAARPGSRVYRGLPHLAELMGQADLMLGAGGATTWERCCLGVPAIVVSAGDNQREFTDMLVQTGAQFGLGRADRVTVSDWRYMLEQLREHPQRLLESSRKAMTFCDGYGVHRIASVLEGRPPRICLRRAASKDELLLLEWANDPLVRQYAFSKEPIDSLPHNQWFRHKLEDPSSVIWIAEDEYGVPVGQVRCDSRHGEGVIDISVDAALRGLGVGRALLQSALTELRKIALCRTVVAEVLIENEPSRKLFMSAGFRPDPQKQPRFGSIRLVLPLNFHG